MLSGTTALVNAGGRYSGEIATVPLQDSPLQSLTDSYGSPGSYPSARQVVYQNSDRPGHSFVVQQQPLPLTGAAIPGMHLDQSEFLAAAAAGYPPYQPVARSLDGSQEMLYDPRVVATGQDQPDFTTYQHHPQQTLLGAAGKCRGGEWVWSFVGRGCFPVSVVIIALAFSLRKDAFIHS